MRAELGQPDSTAENSFLARIDVLKRGTSMRFFSSYKLLLVVIALAVFACAQQETSLGELAKHKGTKKAKIVIGDDDVLHSTAGSQPDTASDAGNGAVADGGASGDSSGAKPTQSGS